MQLHLLRSPDEPKTYQVDIYRDFRHFLFHFKQSFNDFSIITTFSLLRINKKKKKKIVPFFSFVQIVF